VGRGGIVRDPDVHGAWSTRSPTRRGALGLRVVASAPSPVTGADGNREFLLHLRGEGPCP
jgi:23S rRNA (cytidine1920-2'-O)/16S rRNA (cytidine1409-2'-O)-methyltransferase